VGLPQYASTIRFRIRRDPNLLYGGFNHPFVVLDCEVFLLASIMDVETSSYSKSSLVERNPSLTNTSQSAERGLLPAHLRHLRV
jgi:hypothetical protein